MSLMSALGIDRLTPAERFQLVQELLDSLEPEGGAPALTEEQRQELDRRVAALDADPSNVRPWAEAKARILARLS